MAIIITPIRSNCYASLKEDPTRSTEVHKSLTSMTEKADQLTKICPHYVDNDFTNPLSFASHPMALTKKNLTANLADQNVSTVNFTDQNVSIANSTDQSVSIAASQPTLSSVYDECSQSLFAIENVNLNQNSNCILQNNYNLFPYPTSYNTFNDSEHNEIMYQTTMNDNPFLDSSDMFPQFNFDIFSPHQHFTDECSYRSIDEKFTSSFEESEQIVENEGTITNNNLIETIVDKMKQMALHDERTK